MAVEFEAVPFADQSYIVFHSEDIGRLSLVKVAVKLRSRPKRSFWGPGLAGDGIPQILDMRFQIAVTFEHVANFG